MSVTFGDARLPERFWSKVEPEPNTGCWLWTGALMTGYGHLYVRPPRVYRVAHRLAYETLVGPVAEGLVLDHIVCNTRCCVNPDHLRQATHRENILRGTGGSARAARKTECKHGHAFVPGNIMRRNQTSTARVCRTCFKRIANETRRRKRARERLARAAL